MEGSDNLNPRYIKAEAEVRREVIVREIIRIGTGQIIDQTVGIEDNSDKIKTDPGLSKVIEGVVSEIIPEDTVDKVAEGSIGIIVIEMMAITEAGVGLEKDHFQDIMVVIELEVQAIVDQGQDPELGPIGIGIDAIIAGNMIISQGNVPPLEKKEK